jgi:hypothetical protein
VVRGQQGDHRLLGEVDPPQSVVVAPRRGRVLEAHGGVEPPRLHRLDQLGERALLDRQLQLGLLRAQGRDGGGHDRGQRTGKGAQPQRAALGGDERIHLRVGEVEPRRQGVGVREQQLARGSRHRAGAPAHQQRRAQLLLQGAHLLGDRRLAERKRRGGARERALTGDLPEGEQPAWIEHPRSLSVR